MPAESVSTKARVVTVPMEFTESVILGVDYWGSPVEHHADDWFQGAEGFPSWRFDIPPTGRRSGIKDRLEFTSWRLVLASPTGITTAVKSFAPVRLWPADSLTLNWTIHTWSSVVIDQVRRID